MLEVVRLDNLEVLSSPRLEREYGVRVVFTGRLGGVGKEPYDELNLSFNVGDEAASVRQNRDIVATDTAMPLSRWVLAQQVHGSRVYEAGPLDGGRGAYDHLSAIPRTDAILTLSKSLIIGVLTADCSPVVLVSQAGPAVAVVHAGWKGALGGVIHRAVIMLLKRSGGVAGDIIALIGPHVGPCCFAVGEEVASLFRDSIGDESIIDAGGTTMVDLGAVIRIQLEASGLRPENIYQAGLCTVCSEGYFSYRRGKACGRQAALATILEN